MDKTPPPHLESLLAETVGFPLGVNPDQAVAQQIATQRSAGATRRGVFANAQGWSKHPAVRVRLARLCFSREDKHVRRRKPA